MFKTRKPVSGPRLQPRLLDPVAYFLFFVSKQVPYATQKTENFSQTNVCAMEQCTSPICSSRQNEFPACLCSESIQQFNTSLLVSKFCLQRQER